MPEYYRMLAKQAAGLQEWRELILVLQERIDGDDRRSGMHDGSGRRQCVHFIGGGRLRVVLHGRGGWVEKRIGVDGS